MRFAQGSPLPHWARWLLVPVVMSAVGCSDYGPNAACTATRPIAIEVAVTDSISGLGRADSATGFVQSGSYTDSLVSILGSATLLAGGDRLGTYTISISRPGYASWSRSGIHVTQRSICGVVLPVRLDARLQPGP